MSFGPQIVVVPGKVALVICVHLRQTQLLPYTTVLVVGQITGTSWCY